MAKKANMANDNNINNFRHERRNELPLERFKQTAGNEVANSILDAYDNARDRKADNRQQEQRIRDYQQERERTGRNSEQLHFQRNYNVYDAGFSRNSSESTPRQQSYNENPSEQSYSNNSQYAGSVRTTDSAGPSSRVSPGTENHMPVYGAGNGYANPTIDNSRLNAMSSEGQRLARTETSSYEMPQRTSSAQSVRGGGSVSGEINKSASERYAAHKVAVQTPNGIVMVDAADEKKAEMTSYYNDMMSRKQAERVTAQLNAVSQRISSPNRIHVGEDVGGTTPRAPRVQMGYNAGKVNAPSGAVNGNMMAGAKTKGGGIGGNSRTENPALENNRFGITDGTEPDTMDINHNPNTVINPKTRDDAS